jgi:ABC-type multidrug transport system fused ATPase/permease subunit
MSGIAGGKDIRAQLSQPVAVPEDEASTEPTVAGDGSVRFESVHFAYTPGRPVLDDVSFDIPAGQTAALVGPSGSGKTTVTSLLMRFLAPDSGVIRVSGHDVASVPSDWVRRQISLVAQSTFLFHGTLRDNLLVAAPEATDEQMVRALADAALGDFLRDLPQGLDTPVGERGLSISGGQAQRIAIARAFLKDAPLLVLDEPTSNVDAESERAIVEALERLREGRTVLIVAHRLTTIRGADQIIVMDRGRITDAGRHDDLITRGGHYAAAMARLQAVR